MKLPSRQMFGTDNFSAGTVIAKHLHKVKIRGSGYDDSGVWDLVGCVASSPVADITIHNIGRLKLASLNQQVMPNLKALKIDQVHWRLMVVTPVLNLEQLFIKKTATLQHVELAGCIGDYGEFLAGMPVLVQLPNLKKLLSHNCTFGVGRTSSYYTLHISYDRLLADCSQWSGMGDDLLGVRLTSILEAANKARAKAAYQSLPLSREQLGGVH